MNESLVDVRGVSRRFGATLALDDVTFETTPGQVYGLVGANGAGKTTLIRHILGLLRARSGTVRVFGLDPVSHPVEVLRKIGYLSEERDLPDWMRVRELLRYTQAFHPTWDEAYAARLLKNFGLDEDKKIAELSKGMRAQAGLVAAVAHRPELLILDEPSSGLDPVVRQDILDAIVRTVVDDGRTVVFSSHLLDEVERMSDHVTMIHRGRVVLDGTLERVRSTHLRSVLRFPEPLGRAPSLEQALFVQGEGRSWTVVHNGTPDQFRASVALHGAEVLESREASLDEIFIARVGRVPMEGDGA
jgi:ABC-2 type transport system ATP-binding protein